MGMFGEKNPIFIDLDRGICGTFKGSETQGVEAGYVYIDFVPFNSIRSIRYSEPVEAAHIHHIYPHAVEKFVEGHLVIVYGGKEGGAIDFIEKKSLQTIAELKSRIKDLEIENAGAKQRASEAYSGAEQVVTRAKQLQKTASGANQNDPLNPLSRLNDNW